MKYILIMTVTGRHIESGVSIHSIEFNNAASAYAAGDAWLCCQKANQAKDSISLSASYVVVESP